MEDKIGTVLHWSNEKEPKQEKNKDEVIRRDLDRIHISAATPLPSNPSRYSQVSLIEKINKLKNQKQNPHQKIKYFWLPDHVSNQVEILTCIHHHY